MTLTFLFQSIEATKSVAIWYYKIQTRYKDTKIQRYKQNYQPVRANIFIQLLLILSKHDINSKDMSSNSGSWSSN